mmetsp:Transcript_16884/g.40021  ORF Transcript_16884/g.40021 Transcript_16884/m.40021 type:complete len:235 (-) Transcript_16884:279-983(-)
MNCGTRSSPTSLRRSGSSMYVRGPTMRCDRAGPSPPRPSRLVLPPLLRRPPLLRLPPAPSVSSSSSPSSSSSSSSWGGLVATNHLSPIRHDNCCWAWANPTLPSWGPSSSLRRLRTAIRPKHPRLPAPTPSDPPPVPASSMSIPRSTIFSTMRRRYAISWGVRTLAEWCGADEAVAVMKVDLAAGSATLLTTAWYRTVFLFLAAAAFFLDDFRAPADDSSSCSSLLASASSSSF